MSSKSGLIQTLPQAVDFNFLILQSLVNFIQFIIHNTPLALIRICKLMLLNVALFLVEELILTTIFYRAKIPRS